MAVAKGPSLDELLSSFTSRLIQSEESPNINRYQPMPQQDVFHQTQEKHRILFGGNRGGKTYGGIADDVMVLLRRHPYRQHMYANRALRMRFIGVDFDRGIDQAAIPIFSQLIPPSALIDGSWERSYSKSEHMLKLADGSRCSFMSYEQHPNKFQAVSLDHIHFDEEPPVAIWRESMLRLLDTNGTWTLSETPVQQLEWVMDELIEPAENGDRPDIKVFHLDTRDNIYLTDEALDEVVKGLSEEEKIIRLAGQYNLAGSLVFPEFTRKYPNIIPTDFAPRPQSGWKIYASMDYGYSNPTAWGWHAVHKDGSIVTFRLLYSALVTIDEWVKRVHAMNREIGLLIGVRDFRPVAYFGDPSISHNNNGQSGVTNQQAYALGGIPIGTDGIVKMRSTNQNIGLDKMHTYLRFRPTKAGPAASNGEMNMPWWQITENCSAIIDEMRRARKPKQSLNQKEQVNVAEGIRDKDNHAIDMAKYFFMVTHDLRPIELQADTEPVAEEILEAMRPVPTQFTTHHDAHNATMLSDRRRFRGTDDYYMMEG